VCEILPHLGFQCSVKTLDDTGFGLLVVSGKEVQREEGELQAQELRILLKHYGVFRESDHRREQAREKHIAGDTQAAIILSTDQTNFALALSRQYPRKFVPCPKPPVHYLDQMKSLESIV
jgi:hypothetical protein